MSLVCFPIQSFPQNSSHISVRQIQPLSRIPRVWLRVGLEEPFYPFNFLHLQGIIFRTDTSKEQRMRSFFFFEPFNDSIESPDIRNLSRILGEEFTPKKPFNFFHAHDFITMNVASSFEKGELFLNRRRGVTVSSIFLYFLLRSFRCKVWVLAKSDLFYTNVQLLQ